jgi:hypothetical protein
MVLDALGIFLLEISTGISLSLLFYPHRTIGKGFFSLHALIAFLALVPAAAILARPPFRIAAAAAILALGAYGILARAGRGAAGRVWLAASGLLQAALLAVRAGSIEPKEGVWLAGGAMVGALLFGSAVLAMNLGHWYLVSRSLPMRLLSGAAAAFAVFAVARVVLLAAAALWASNREGWDMLTSLDREGLFFAFRVVWGLAGPLALSYFVFRTARMRSNQAATGLLYVALVFVLVGELLSAYLTVRTKFPA